MNKILLIAIAMIAMIGTASASPAQISLSGPINIIPDGSSITTVEVRVFDYNFSQGTDRHLTGNIVANTDVEIRLYNTTLGVNTGWITYAGGRIGLNYTSPSSGNYDTSTYFNLDVRGKEPGTINLCDNSGTSYLPSDAYDYAVLTTRTTVPEFPTIALPIAAILGLAFIFQRRKEEE